MVVTSTFEAAVTQRTLSLFQSGLKSMSKAKHDFLGAPVKARCDCGETWVFVGWPMRPCGKCKQSVTLDADSLAEWSKSKR